MRLKSKITDLFKEKTLMSKFNEIDECISKKSENSNNCTNIKHKNINWSENLSKNSYNTWKLEYFHHDLIDLINSRGASIIESKFLKTKNNAKKLQIIIQTHHAVNTQGLFVLICTSDFNQNLINPTIEKKQNSNDQYQITFDILEERELYDARNKKRTENSKRSKTKPELTN